MTPEPLVFVPGLLCSPRLFAAQSDALGGAREVLVADSAADDTMVGIAAAILRQAPRRFALAGLSMGGYIALEIMRQQPGRVTRLALLDTGARADTQASRENRLRLVRLAEKKGPRAVQQELLPKLILPRRIGEQPLTSEVLAMADDVGLAGFKRQMSAIMNRPDSRADLAAIACPCLVLVGVQDLLTPPELAREIADALPDARLEVVPDCGHLSTMERPAAVTAALRDWLEA